MTNLSTTLPISSSTNVLHSPVEFSFSFLGYLAAFLFVGNQPDIFVFLSSFLFPFQNFYEED